MALVSIAALGNLRGIASEVRAETRSSGVATGWIDPSLVALATDRPAGNDADGVGEEVGASQEVAPDTEEQARLVPAIFAWDPDVRFVYYRHVSKWM